MRVMLRWQPGSVGSTHLAYLNGHVGVINSWDSSSRRWQVGFETFDGHLDVAAEHLQVWAAEKASKASKPQEAASCEMCLGRFLESQVVMLPCPEKHGYCETCLRKWILTQLVPRCYKCLDELSVLALPQGASEPWCGLVTSEAQASAAYRIGKEDIEQLSCMCCFDVSCGARCVIIGYPGLVGERCVVGRVEKTKTRSFAVVYLSNGRRHEMDLGCLEVDDCLSSGRQARGETCPSKSERLGLGLSVASLGCACVVKQAMDEMFVEQLAMPFDWLVTRVEGVLYFFRHHFRDFTHYDDVQVVGEHGFTSFRSAYHAFPHHDLSTSTAREAFQRRAERMMDLVISCREASARPLLLVRVCARSEELDQSEELYHLLRLLGGQKVFLLVVITEQIQNLGAVQHIRLSNLILYVCKVGSADLVDAVRFGMDYVYMAVAFGRHTLDAAKAISPVSPVPDAATLRQMLKPHKHWLTRDRRGLSPTSDLEGCFETGPGRFFPGRFRGGGASPYYDQDLEKMVLSSTAADLASFLTGKSLQVNAWNSAGETVLWKAFQRGDLDILALLLLQAADPNASTGVRRAVAAEGSAGGAARRLLRLAAGQPMSLAKAYETLQEVSEPHRRLLCGRLGAFMPPEVFVAADGGGARASAVAQLLFAAPTVSAAKGVRGGYEALQELQRNAGKPLEARRQVLRQLLRSWHPDKHQSASLQQQEEANQIFCFIQKLRDVFLQPSPG
ncbi:Hypothetical protein (Fragment) [Durusdinium trenchii]